MAGSAAFRVIAPDATFMITDALTGLNRKRIVEFIATALGLTIPPSILARADEVIE